MILLVFAMLFGGAAFARPGQLQSPRAIRGSVIDGKSGQGLAGATVTLTGPWSTEAIVETETGEGGQFTFHGLADGRYRVRAAKPGYVDLALAASPNRVVTVPETEGQPAAIVLTPAAVISGMVVNAAGQPVRGVSVIAMVRRLVGGAVRLVPRGRAVVVDDRGEYRLYDLAPGTYTVAVALSRVRPGAVFAPVYYPGVARADRAEFFALESGGIRPRTDVPVMETGLFHVRGFVSGLAEDWSGGRVMVSLLSEQGMLLGALEAGRGGRFEFAGLPPGSYELAAAGPVIGLAARGPATGANARQGRLTVDVDMRDVVNVGISLRPPMAIQGEARVTPRSGTAVDCLSGARITLIPSIPPPIPADLNAIVDRNGHFVFPRVFDGTYRVSVRGMNGRCFVERVLQGETQAEDRSIVIDGGRDPANFTVLLSSDVGAVDGRVVTTGEKPARGAWVCLIPEGSGIQTTDERLGAVATDENGLDEFAHVQPGNYRLIAVPSIDSIDYLDPFFWKEQSEGLSVAVKVGEKTGVELRIVQ